MGVLGFGVPVGDVAGVVRIHVAATKRGIASSAEPPAGLTTQVGFIRLAHYRCPNSGKPEFGWSIFFARLKGIFASGWIARNSGLPEFRISSAASRVDPTCGVKPGNDGRNVHRRQAINLAVLRAQIGEIRSDAHRPAGRPLDQLVRLILAPMPVDIVAQPAVQRAEIPLLDLARNFGMRCDGGGMELRAENIADGTSVPTLIEEIQLVRV